jgi:uncharacterized protein
VDVRLLDDVEEFARRAGPLLLADEPRHNLALGIVGTLREHGWRYPERRFWIVEEDGIVIAAALRTPPHGLVLADPLAAAGLEALAAEIDEELPGAVGATPEIETFARAWACRRGVGWSTRFRQGIFALERLVPPRPCPGAARIATEEDRGLLVDWLRAFAVEALGETDPDPAALEANVEHRLVADDGAYVLWEVEGVRVALAGYGSSTPTGSRVGPVYTPPEHRGRGYGSSVTAWASADRLAAGYRFCFLYTDLANPTSNKIYRDLGYEHVCDSAQVEFED